MLFSLAISHEASAQRVVIESVANTGPGGGNQYYAIINCYGLPKASVKSVDELRLSKQSVGDGGRTLLHTQNGTNPQGNYDGDKYGTTALFVNEKVSSKFAISTTDVGADGTDVSGHSATLDWYAAAGFTTGGELAKTGCAAYKGRGAKDNAGTWRVPTQRELVLIYTHDGQLLVENTDTGFVEFISGNYWSATHESGTNHWSANFSNSEVITTANNEKIHVRCVRDL